MLFARPIGDLQHQDVKEFCARFAENIRVEYKSTFDQNVKRKLPRVLSAFANAYGGVLIIGVRATNGIPEEPIEGIVFTDPEPRLTLENICRENIFPEVPLVSKVVASAVPGRAFLVTAVTESPKAPHAIENSTQVYVRTGDSVERTALANIQLTERLLLRRREVLGRWNDFYHESLDLATRMGIDIRDPVLELKIGPLYPTETILSREDAFSFLTDPQRQHSLGLLNMARRHASGALLARSNDCAKYMNIGQLGTMHYLEPLRHANYGLQARRPDGANQESKHVYPLWWIVQPIVRVIRIVSALLSSCGVACSLRVEATLSNIAGVEFTLAIDNSPWATLPVSSISRNVSASLEHSSEMLGQRVYDVVTELVYQLRWPFGTEAPHTREEIRNIVSKIA